MVSMIRQCAVATVNVGTVNTAAVSVYVVAKVYWMPPQITSLSMSKLVLQGRNVMDTEMRFCSKPNIFPFTTCWNIVNIQCLSCN